MDDRVRTIDRVERALDVDPFCPACGGPTDVLVDDGQLVLRCRASVEPLGLRRRLAVALQPHLRIELGELPPTLAA